MMSFLQIGSLIEPPSVEFSFDAPAWYVLGVFLLLCCMTALTFWLRRYKKNEYRRTALAFLVQQEKEAHPVDLLYASNVLMKRIVLERYGRVPVAGLRDKEWIAFLNATHKCAAFNDVDAQLLHKLYTQQSLSKHEINDFLNKTKKWIKTHRTGESYSPPIIGESYSPPIIGESYSPPIIGESYSPQIRA